MRFLGLIFIGCVFCGSAAYLAEHASWMEAVANSSIPYGAAPFASGFLTRRSHPVGAALLGALTTLAMLLAFYGTNALLSPYPLSTGGPYFWSLAGTASGAALGLMAWWLRSRTNGRSWTWGLVSCAALAISQLAIVLSPTPYTEADLVALALAVGFWCGIVLIAMRTCPDTQAVRADAALGSAQTD